MPGSYIVIPLVMNSFQTDSNQLPWDSSLLGGTPCVVETRETCADGALDP